MYREDGYLSTVVHQVQKPRAKRGRDYKSRADPKYYFSGRLGPRPGDVRALGRAGRAGSGGVPVVPEHRGGAQPRLLVSGGLEGGMDSDNGEGGLYVKFQCLARWPCAMRQKWARLNSASGRGSGKFWGWRQAEFSFICNQF